MSKLHLSHVKHSGDERRHNHRYSDHNEAEDGRAKNREVKIMAILVKTMMVVAAVAVFVGGSSTSPSSFMFVSSLSTINSSPTKIRRHIPSSSFHHLFRNYHEKTATATMATTTNSLDTTTATRTVAPTSKPSSTSARKEEETVDGSTHNKKSRFGLIVDENIATGTKTTIPSCLLLIFMLVLPPPLILPISSSSQTPTDAKTIFLSRPAYAVKERNEVLCGTGFFTNIAQYVCTDIGDISDERGPGRSLNQQELQSTDSLMDKLSIRSTSPISSSTTSSSSSSGDEGDSTSLPTKKE